MPANLKVLTDFLVNLGIEQISHTQKNYLAHLISVHRLMQTNGYDDDLCRAGLFHSIYGTEKFQGFKLPLEQREELVELIGRRAERLAYWNCLMDRESLDELLTQPAEPFLLRNRESGEAMPLTQRELDDLCCVHLFDWLEQAPRSRYGWDYRRQAYRQMAERLGGRAIEVFDQVYSGAPASAVTSESTKQ
ncbi:MAG: hypothetical protein JWM11_347 [Planctomycetaceae bacterium]|nr:hypothetical protein [Planctomycetaceae bacterium]